MPRLQTEDASSALARLDGEDTDKGYTKTDREADRDGDELQRRLEPGEVSLVRRLARVLFRNEGEQAAVGHARRQLEEDAGNLEADASEHLRLATDDVYSP